MKKLLTVILVALSLSLAFGLFACGGTVAEVTEITAKSEIKMKLQDFTDEKLLDGVKAILSDGTEKVPTLNKGGEITKAGRYEISYSCEGKEAKTVLYLFDTPVLYYKGEALEGDKIEIKYPQAYMSYNFTKDIEIKDSFGKVLSTEKASDSQDFSNAVGEYTVTYTATDEVGNVLNKKITYNVVAGNVPIITAENSYVLSTELCKIPCDLKGNTEAVLYYDGQIVSLNDYYFDSENIIFNLEYLISIGEGKHDFRIMTTEGDVNFSITVTDEGNPLFKLVDIKENYVLGGAFMSMPEKIALGQEIYSYEYQLKDADGKDFAVKEEDGKIIFVDTKGGFIPVGEYTLQVKGSGASKVSVITESFTVENPKVKSEGGFLSLKEVELDESVYGVDKALKFSRSNEEIAYYGRLEYECPIGAYSMMYFDIYFTSCTESEGDKVNARLTVVVDNDYGRIISIVEKDSGTEVAEEDMLLNKWYTVAVNAYSETDGLVSIYCNPFDGAKVGAEGYFISGDIVLVSGLTQIAFVKYESNLKLTQTSENGEVLYHYTNYAGADWGGRIQFSEKMLSEYQKYYALHDGYTLNMSIKWTDEKARIQFWNIVEGANRYGDQPTLESLINDGRAIARKDGEKVTYGEMVAGEWYDIQMSLERLGNVIKVESDCGWQMASIKDFEFKNVYFDTVNELIDGKETQVNGDDNTMTWPFDE